MIVELLYLEGLLSLFLERQEMSGFARLPIQVDSVFPQGSGKRSHGLFLAELSEPVPALLAGDRLIWLRGRSG